MRRTLFSGTLALALLLTFAPTADGAGPPYTASLKEEGRAVAHDSAVIEVPTGATVLVQKFVLPPGFSGLWPSTPGDTVIVATKGALSTFGNCTDKGSWESGHAYHRRAGTGPAELLVKNEGKEPVELIVGFFNAPANQPEGTVPSIEPASAACAPRGTFTPTELGRVVNHKRDTLEMEAGTQVVVQSFLVEPGFNFFWHRHPGPTIVLQKAGTITEYHRCDHKLVWEPGYAYVHTPGHHGHDQMTAKNEGKETADFLVFFFNVPTWQPAPLVPRNVEPPPQDCPTTSLM